ncbi:gamma-glutamyltransferase [Acanthopleuribacter pedis]|uniref:Glutathione hydrolase proenzyme n=1 Tax=Acanthopleuribacter pedis TaxID=442870 RepID=A0A8J7QTQ3_9BACT|nr:gamma-glutamyltransferase [Acanthopleuribacter pedis]MBO1323258.1 gamma-glutamyltransferase [Acanthopleuribacter pedis]
MKLAFRLLVPVWLGLLATGPLVFAQIDRVTGRAFATRSEVFATQGMVATSQPLATQIGLDILKAGGSAVDAAIAANAALGLMEPTGCGIGGDLYAIVWDAKSGKLHGLNASGRSPLGLSLAELKKEVAALGREDIPPYGMLPISVPGAVSGWQALHDRFGRLPLKQVLNPAISYAEKGFPVSELIAHYWRLSVPRLRDQPGSFVKTFTIDGKAPAKGQIFRNPELAATYRQIAEQGAAAFYQGELADAMHAFFKENGGWLRKVDFEKHRADWVEPVSVAYRGTRVWELPPNGQGIAALQMLQILKAYDLKAMGHNSAEFLHLMVETKKLVFEDRAKYYSDLSFNKVPVAGLISDEYAAERRTLINPERAARRLEAGNPALQHGDTIYLTTADKDGNMVSLIQSNYRGMGSGVVVPGLGFVFQDRGQLFALEADHLNVYAPGKRPFQTIIPAFVTKDGKPYLSFGVMGGPMQPQGHVQILVNILDFGMNLQEAGDAARWQHVGSSEPTGTRMTDGGVVELESAIPWETVRALRRKGHRVQYGNGGFGGYQAIMLNPETGVYTGASESRKDGQAAGY